jgi:superfamily II DNA or RNA helicase
MDTFITDIHRLTNLIYNSTDLNEEIQCKHKVKINCIKFIKLKSIKFFGVYFNLAKEKKHDLKYFIQTELDEYYKNYNPSEYVLFKSFQQFQLDELEKYQKTLLSDKNFREKKQLEYIDEISKQLNLSNRCFVKAPTGFGKTVLYYKTIKHLNLDKILIFTPRLALNEQIVESKYLNYLEPVKYKIKHYSNSPNSSQKKEKIDQIKKYCEKNKKFILTSCYQSEGKLLEYINEHKIKFDLIIFDEAHTNEKFKDSEFVKSDKIAKYRIFGSATPTENIESNKEIFGEVIEKVKVYELINRKILCDIVTIIKKLDEHKSEYHNLKNLIIETMKKHNKKKGIIYVNSKANAQSLYDLMKTQNEINTYIYVSGEVNVESESDTNINDFELDIKQSVIIAVGKISYGYDNPLIDFICLGDPRQSDADIRQILGRGLRWNHDVYPNKLLHVLVPMYKNQFGEYGKNDSLKKYLDYIIGEFGKDSIVKFDGIREIVKSTGQIEIGKDYDGSIIPIDILKEYCTTGYNKFTDFMKFLKINECWNETKYNVLRELNKDWMVEIGSIKKKYPNFSFQQLCPDRNKFYQTKEEAVDALEKAKKKLKNEIGGEKMLDLTDSQLINKIIKIDNKITPVNFELYY